MSDVATPTEELTEADLRDAGPLLEGEMRLIVQESGQLFEDDGTCRVAIIRPCVSRGRRLRGLPPIYTPSMLAENATVFTGWLMYMDHLTERMVETVRSRGRSINELGGRVLESWFDPTFTHKDDARYGYQPGAVIGKVLPQPAIRAMLEADPEILNVSINAYPKGAREGVAPWDAGLKGMLIEGIREQPQGSVDWVPRGGAGGRVLQEDEERAVTILESYYDGVADAPNDSEVSEMDLKTTTPEQLREALERDNPGVLVALRETFAPAPSGNEETLTRSEVEQLLAEQRRDMEAQLAERDVLVETELDLRLAERETLDAHGEIAEAMIAASGLPPRWQEDLRGKWGGSSPALLTEATDEKGADEVLRESVAADIEHARALIEEVGGRPSVTLPGGAPSSKHRPNAKRGSLFRDFLAERAGGGKVEDDDIKSMVREGVEH